MPQQRARIRSLGIVVGELPTGPFNAITDVAGVLVGHTTLIYDQPCVARTGVTAIVPRNGAIADDCVFAGFHRFNGFGEMTGIQWIDETGLLTSPIILTTTNQIGMVRDAVTEYGFLRYQYGAYYLPVVAETYDGWLNEMHGHPIQKEHVFQAFDSARSGPVTEGCVGGGTGMICHDFKGGIGTSSRLVSTDSGNYTVGALVQTNYGDRKQLQINGVPVGREIGFDIVPHPWQEPPRSSSIIIIIATDAPLLPVQCKRLAQRATSGLARIGGFGHNSSGDLFLAFATGNHITEPVHGIIHLEGMLPNDAMDGLFDATVEAVEESILNALTTAETMTGYQGHTVYAIPLDLLQQVIKRYRPD